VQLENIGLNIGEVNLGSAEVQPAPDSEQLNLISSQLKLLPFELLTNEKRTAWQNGSKNLIVEKCTTATWQCTSELSQYLMDSLKDYAYPQQDVF